MPKHKYYNHQNLASDNWFAVQWGDEESTGVAVYDSSGEVINLVEDDLDDLIKTLNKIKRGLSEVVRGDRIRIQRNSRRRHLTNGTELVALDGDYKGWLFRKHNDDTWSAASEDYEGKSDTRSFDESPPDGEYVVVKVGHRVEMNIHIEGDTTGPHIQAKVGDAIKRGQAIGRV
jgi:hypothetical protein